jgi:hypothetical protein
MFDLAALWSCLVPLVCDTGLANDPRMPAISGSESATLLVKVLIFRLYSNIQQNDS